MGLIKDILRLVKRVVIIAIILAGILYPLIVLKVNPITFYLEKLKLIWEVLKTFDFKEFISSIRHIKNGV